VANTWYFPARSGEWASLSVRRIRWTYTFYPDGRAVTHLELNNAGGRQIGTVRVRLRQRAAWAQMGVSQEMTLQGFRGPVGRWSYQQAPVGPPQELMERNYLKPGQLRPTLAGAAAPAPGDANGDGFDESQGCYFLRAKRGHCRFTLVPPPGGLLGPVFRVAGPYRGRVSVNREGQAIREATTLPDGSVLFVLYGLIDRPTSVEVVGKPAPPR
jgi:hypothetical protein